MSEGPPVQLNSREKLLQSLTRERTVIIDLGRELSESREVFQFAGMEPAAYEKIQADTKAQIAQQAEGSGRGHDISSPSIDELIDRMAREGIQVALGRSLGVFILPALSDATDRYVIQDDSIPPRSLQIAEGMDPRLIQLIQLDRAYYTNSLGLAAVKS